MLLVPTNILDDRCESRVARTSWPWRRWTSTTRHSAKTRSPETVMWRKSSQSSRSSKNRQSFVFNHWQSIYNLSDLEQLFFVLFMCWFVLPLKMTHPNVVKYYKTFLEGEDNYLHWSLSPLGRHITKIQSWISLFISGDRLYIVMELIEGVPLAEHFSSLKEKQQQFTEDRIWNIFIQVTT